MQKTEKVSNIGVRARFLNSNPDLDLPNAFTFIGSGGLLFEAIAKDFNPILTVWLVAIAAYGALGSELIDKGENIRFVTSSESDLNESSPGTLEIIS